MKTFSSIMLASVATAQYSGASYANNDANLASGGTTGHFGNQYGHGGQEDHSHQDHIYGYDSIAADWDLDADDNDDLAVAIIAAIEEAQVFRLDYLQVVFERRELRLEQMKDMNELKIEAPFEYQIELIEEEQADVRSASNEAIKDVNDAYDDMIFRLEKLADDIVREQLNEKNSIIQTLQRAITDRKKIRSVFYALRIEWMDQITIDEDTGVTTYVADSQNFEMYEGIFDDFHYDIGHGKATHEGSVDNGPVNDGYSGAPSRGGPVGDWERDTGAAVSSWERPGGNRQGYGY